MVIRNSTVLIIVLVALDHHLGRFTLLNSVFIQILSGYHACRFYRLNFMSLVIKFGNLLLCVHDLCSYILIRRSFTSELCYCSWYCLLKQLRVFYSNHFQVFHHLVFVYSPETLFVFYYAFLKHSTLSSLWRRHFILENSSAERFLLLKFDLELPHNH